MGRRLSILDVFRLGAWFLLLQTLLGAVAAGITLAGRASPGGTRRVGLFVGVSLVVALLPVVPLCGGMLWFARGWEHVFQAIAGTDPTGQCTSLFASMPLPRADLARGILAAGSGLLLSCALVAWFIIRGQGSGREASGQGSERDASGHAWRAGGRALAIAGIVACLGGAAWIWRASQSYVLPAPANGPIQRFLAAAELPPDLLRRLRADPTLAQTLRQNITLSDELLQPPTSTSPSPCLERHSTGDPRRG